MLRVAENQKPQSRPENYDNSAKLELIKKKSDFEPLVIARPTEIIEKLLPRFDSSCRKLLGEKIDERKLFDSKCNSISHAMRTARKMELPRILQLLFHQNVTPPVMRRA